MPATSKQQANFFQIVDAIKKGKIKGKGAAAKAAEDMSEKQVSDFTKTPTKNLPNKKVKEGLNFKHFFNL